MTGSRECENVEIFLKNHTACYLYNNDYYPYLIFKQMILKCCVYPLIIKRLKIVALSLSIYVTDNLHCHIERYGFPMCFTYRVLRLISRL